MSVYALFTSNHPQVSSCLHVSAMRSLSPDLHVWFVPDKRTNRWSWARKNQSILKLCCLLFFGWKREFCRVFYSGLQYFGQLLSGFNMVHNACTGNLILCWLFPPLGDTCINQTPTEQEDIQNNSLCQTNGVKMHVLCCRHWPGVQNFGAQFLALSRSVWWEVRILGLHFLSSA